MIPYTFDPSIMSNKKKIKAAMKAMDEDICPFQDSKNVKMSQNISKFLEIFSFSTLNTSIFEVFWFEIGCKLVRGREITIFGI